MPRPPLPDELRALLAKPNPAVIAAVRPDGHPVSVATWYLLEDDGRILVNMDVTRKRLEHLRQDPRVAITVLDEAGWYTHVSIVGEVTQMQDDEGLADIDRLSHHYLGQPYKKRDSPRVSAWVEIERYHGWGRARTRR